MGKKVDLEIVGKGARILMLERSLSPSGDLRLLAHGEIFGSHFPQALSMLVEGFPQLPEHSFQFGWILSGDGLGDQGIDPILKVMWRQGRGPKRDTSEVRSWGSIQEIL